MTNNNVDQGEIAKFSSMAQSWWDPQGSFKLIHKLNPLRTDYVMQEVAKTSLHHPALKKVLDLGCGAGILCESLAYSGALVTGVDMSKEALEAGKKHAQESGLSIEYLHLTAEELAAQRPGYFDLVTCMEMVEHVPDFRSILASAKAMLKEEGLLVMSTINRTKKAQFEIITVVEDILNWLPSGTHEYEKFITPNELMEAGKELGLEVVDVKGYKYNPFLDKFYLDNDCSVNYLITFKKLAS